MTTERVERVRVALGTLAGKARANLVAVLTQVRVNARATRDSIHEPFLTHLSQRFSERFSRLGEKKKKKRLT